MFVTNSKYRSVHYVAACTVVCAVCQGSICWWEPSRWSTTLRCSVSVGCVRSVKASHTCTRTTLSTSTSASVLLLNVLSVTRLCLSVCLSVLVALNHAQMASTALSVITSTCERKKRNLDMGITRTPNQRPRLLWNRAPNVKIKLVVAVDRKFVVYYLLTDWLTDLLTYLLCSPLCSQPGTKGRI